MTVLLNSIANKYNPRYGKEEAANSAKAFENEAHLYTNEPCVPTK